MVHSAVAADSTEGFAATTPGARLPPGVSEHFLEAGGIRFRFLQGGAASGSR